MKKIIDPVLGTGLILLSGGNDIMQNTLIISTSYQIKDTAQALFDSLDSELQSIRLLDTEAYSSHHCNGCTSCWLKTPGRCSIKDGCEDLLQTLLWADDVIFASETALGFVDYKCKNVVDRLLPLMAPYIDIVDGAARHRARYQRKWRFGLFYTGKPGNDYLSYWLERFSINFYASSLGAFHETQKEELKYALSYH